MAEAGAPAPGSQAAAARGAAKKTAVVEALLRNFDRDGDGSLDRGELVLALRATNADAWTDDKVDMLLSAAGGAAAGRIQIGAFADWICTAPPTPTSEAFRAALVRPPSKGPLGGVGEAAGSTDGILPSSAVRTTGDVVIRYSTYAESFRITDGKLESKKVDETYRLSESMPGCCIQLVDGERVSGEEDACVREDPMGTFLGLVVGATYSCYVRQDLEQERRDGENRSLAATGALSTSGDASCSYSERCAHFSLRRGQRLTPPDHPHPAVVSCELVTVVGGATSLAHQLYSADKTLRLGLMVAANSGRPGGACGGRGKVMQIHPRHTTQEEDIVANWMLTEAGRCQRMQNKLFNSTIDQRWGLEEVEGESTATFQGVDYMRTLDPLDYADAWVVRGALVSAKTAEPTFDVARKAPCVLVFVAGPNAGASGLSTGSTARTKNAGASRASAYGFFREALKAGLRAGLEAMAAEGVDVALVARVSCGIYAGVHRGRINDEFVDVVNELLQEPIRGTDVLRGRCFARVIVPMLP